MHILDSVDAASLRTDVPEFRAGDTLKVHVNIIEGKNSRVQVFQGFVLGRHGDGLRETFTVRKVSFGVGVERTFPVHSPIIEKIELVSKGDVRRAKLYYMRDLRGKAAKIKEKRDFQTESKSFPGLTPRVHGPYPASAGSRSIRNSATGYGSWTRQNASPGNWAGVLCCWRWSWPSLISGLVRSLWLDVYFIPSASMEPLFREGDRILVSRTDFQAEPVRRGDIVVFDGRGSFAPLNSGKGPVLDFLAGGRALARPGRQRHHLRQTGHRAAGRPRGLLRCGRQAHSQRPASRGTLSLSTGTPRASRQFSVIVPAGRLWLMGDHRSMSADSRSLLGAPGGGMVPLDRVIGRPVQIIWPLDRFAAVARPPRPRQRQKNGQ